jgi:hypothetical protein
MSSGPVAGRPSKALVERAGNQNSVKRIGNGYRNLEFGKQHYDVLGGEVPA